MKKITLKELKNMVIYSGAIDITKADTETLKTIKHDSECMAISSGAYGMNGGLFINNVNGEKYVILSRSTSLFYMV